MRCKRFLALITLIPAVSVALLGPVSTALGASNPVITDCVAHGALTRTYTIGELHTALGALSAETREYTNCQDVINRAIAADVSGNGTGGTGSSGSGSFLPTPVIVILVVLILAAVAFGALAIRRRRGDDPPD